MKEIFELKFSISMFAKPEWIFLRCKANTKRKKSSLIGPRPLIKSLIILKHTVMTPLTKLFCGIILLTVPTIQYGGYFLLTILSGKAKFPLTDFQKSMFRAGHAHAGVLVLLALVAQVLVDYAGFGSTAGLLVRIGFGLAAILVSAGFFAAASAKNSTKPGPGISILYTGVFILAASVVSLGIALISTR
jgi:hypothetical protein